MTRWHSATVPNLNPQVWTKRPYLVPEVVWISTVVERSTKSPWATAPYSLRYKRPMLTNVGCGHGHWGQRLAPFLAPDARLLGIDREAQWVEIARARAETRGLGERFTLLDLRG